MFTLLNMSTLKERIEEAAKDKGVSLQQARADLIKLLGMSRSNMTHWFGGRAKEPKGAAAVKAADYFGVNVLWFAQGEGLKRHNGKEQKVPAKPPLSPEAIEVAQSYDVMDSHVQEVVRRHMRDMNEALGSPSPTNPFGKGKRQPPRKAAAKKPPRGGGTQ